MHDTSHQFSKALNGRVNHSEAYHPEEQWSRHLDEVYPLVPEETEMGSLRYIHPVFESVTCR